MTLWLGAGGSAYADSGLTQQFAGQPIGLVVANPARPSEVVAVVNSGLQITQTGGVVWRASYLPAVVRSFYFDSVEPGRLFAGTDQGLYVSSNYASTWSLFETNLTSRKIVSSVVSNEEGVYALMGSGVGSPPQIYRFTRSGSIVGITQPGDNLSTIVYDQSTRRMYAGAAGGVVMSTNNTASWQNISNGTGQFTVNIVAKGSALWQLSADGLYRSGDGGASWNILSRPGDINHTFYGNDMHVRGLAVSNDRVFFGDNSFSFPYKFLVQYDAEARSILDYKTNDVAAAGNTLWAATDNGLWSSNKLITSEAKVRRPVIVIPGILGSWPVPASVAKHYLWEDLQFWNRSYKTSLVLDPIEHTYDGLMNDLVLKGYERNKTLFPFPYQWRQDNVKTAGQLAQKIADVKGFCGCPKVDLVGHSMGGLVARQYIESDAYQNDVQNLIQIATPNAGSVDSYDKWEAGEFRVGDGIKNNVAHTLFESEALHAGHVTLLQYVRQNVVTVQQLLPIFNYINGRTYPEGYPRNQFLENLNIPANVDRLKQRVTLYLLGSKTHDTLSNLDVADATPTAEIYPHGKILHEYRAPGDGTVTDTSLQSIAGVSAYLTGDHGGMVAQSPDFVAQTLEAGYLQPVASQAISFNKYLLVYVKSPVAISITDPDGLKVNDNEVSIPEAYYTGSDDDGQLALIPAYKTGTYKISLTGIGSGGLYGVGVKELAANGVVSHKSELSGTVAVGGVDDYTYSTDSNILSSIKPKGLLPQPSQSNDRPVVDNNPAVSLSSQTKGTSAVEPVQTVAIQSDNSDLALRQDQSSLAVEGHYIPTPERILQIAGAKKNKLQFTTFATVGILLMICLAFVGKRFYSLHLRK